MIDIAITDQPLDLGLTDRAASPANGAITVFVGTVRNQTGGRKVLRLEYEAYRGMAEKEMRKIAEFVQRKWPVRSVVMHHRTGTVRIGETVVIIAVGAERRDAAFRACRFAIDTLKETVPIWKKEVFEDGEEWVQPHP